MRSFPRQLQLVGEILVSCGLVVLLFMAYMYWGTAERTASAQRGFARELQGEWASPQTGLVALADPGTVAIGRPFALIRIPRFGRNWQFAIVQGTGLPQLALGPGHVPGTALPGQLGNFAVAGHRVTAGNPFWSLPSLRRGDLVDVLTGAGTYIYRIVGRPVLVSPADSAMLAPVPGQPGAAPHRRLITLITCDPAWTGTSRVIATGVLVRAQPRAAAGGGR
ncbi:MAG: class E sortase [Streptosporangiaceae bacterium]